MTIFETGLLYPSESYAHVIVTPLKMTLCGQMIFDPAPSKAPDEWPLCGYCLERLRTITLEGYGD